MNRHSIFTLSATIALGLVLLPTSLFAQGTLKQQLVGTWTLVSCDIKQPYCINPVGTLMLDASGRYAQLIAARGRPKAASGAANRADVKPEEYKAIAQGLLANFGTWSVNEADKTLANHLKGALFPNVEGTDINVSISLIGDELKTVGANPTAGGFVWRRAK